MLNQSVSKYVWAADLITKLSSAFYSMAMNDFLNLDIKLENILMMDMYTPVVSDLGLSMRTYEVLRFTAGTPGYVAPEIL